MTYQLIKFWLCNICVFIFFPTFSQMQACPVNINFSSGTLTHWFAYTGNNKDGNGATSIKQTYDSAIAAPTGTLGATAFPEYNLPSVSGIQTIITPGTDVFGGFSTIPIINGYAYNYSILLGSTSISQGVGGNRGGYTRGVSYKINVPVSSVTQPYTMTYAYAMVLENGSHPTNDQPLFTATLNTPGGTIDCADASYKLPTLPGSGSNNAILDKAAAIQYGFSLSGTISPNNGQNNESRYRVWTKGWTEVTFDLSLYRGQQVTLTFEADNCTFGGHFAYAYIALKNECAGLIINGDSVACTNSTLTYSIPSLKDATYHWTVPNTWQITSDTTNIITVKAGSQGGQIIASEINGCADLRDTIQVSTSLPSLGGKVTGDNTVCEGINASNLVLNGNLGGVLRWLSSTNGLTWNTVPATTTNYTATNLTATTFYKALVQNGSTCVPDSSTEATIIVDAKSVGGTIIPANSVICEGQNKDAILTLTGNTGGVMNWQSSQDKILWINVNPVDTGLVFNINGITVPTQYRSIVKSGVCGPDTSSIASVAIFPAKYPLATTYPADTTICFGTTAQLYANVLTGTSYTWSGYGGLYDQGNGTIGTAPSFISAQVAPSKTTDYILNILNADCPIPLKDTFHIIVTPKVIVNAGHDTSVIANQPLQLNAFVNNSTENYTWLWMPPAIGLNNTTISNPIADLSSGIDSVRYMVRATSTIGCYGEDDIVIHVFKTGPEIFVPSAFTPNGDGRNDILKPIPVGITKLDFFRVYNRWGQLLYSSSIIGNGWDGTLNGTQQPSGAYIYMTQGADYKGNTVFRKGTVVLIR
jgi:gliding motility-associated-like protein